ncbi:MAG: hypothetical protein M1825_003515 [Sarcosagium campestre]|nr:MAG: hypothetical protein M1825_003515 [Sarcosagium campestre]
MVRLPQRPTTLLSLLCIVLSSSHRATANPYPRPIPFAEISGAHILDPRQCANPCGWSGQLCCSSDQTCITDTAGQAQCSSGGGGNVQAQDGSGSGQWQYYTTTIVETDLVTRVSTWSSYVGGGVATAMAHPTLTAAVVAATPANCPIPCGSICCANGQYCVSTGQCGASGNDFSSYMSASVLGVPTSYSAPLRPTSGTTAVETAGATATVSFGAPATGTAGAAVYGSGAAPNKGLSGGAIAGIVIGVIVGIIVLLFICITVCLGKTIGGIFGGRRRRRTEEVYVHESRHGSGSRPWYGDRPSRIERPEKKSGLLGGFGPIAGALGGLALILGLKRRHDRKKESSYSGGSSYYSSDYTSSSE